MTSLVAGDRAVVLGLGVAGSAAARALRARGITVVAIEDRPNPDVVERASKIGAELVAAPNDDELRTALHSADAFVPSPGIPEAHPAFGLAAELGLRTVSEFDLAAWWDDRPIAAITGTDGKTSVTMLAVDMLIASGVSAAGVGNTDVPLVEAIDDPTFDVFVVEASSFRLGHSEAFAPLAAAWLNFSPDHLDVHENLERYELAKASIWANLPADGLAVAPVDDEVVLRHLPEDRTVTLVSVDEDPSAAGFVASGQLVLDGVTLGPVDELPRAFDHDITNTLVAAALALRLGATVEGIWTAVTRHELAPHRIQHVADVGGVSYYNDSKATVPHAVVTAVRAFDSVVLIAGGKNKNIDLSELASVSDRTRAVVAIGDAADEVVEVFEGLRPTHRASTMDDAVRTAAGLAADGDAVLLSPGCASFDAYNNYAERGEDFIRAVRELEVVS